MGSLPGLGEDLHRVAGEDESAELGEPGQRPGRQPPQRVVAQLQPADTQTRQRPLVYRDDGVVGEVEQGEFLTPAEQVRLCNIYLVWLAGLVW